MKLGIYEKVKHRLVGPAGIFSLGAIFLPTLFKKSSQHLENNFSVNVQLPPKPKAPDVAVANEKEMFKTIKVATIKIPPLAKQNVPDAKKEDYIHSVALHQSESIHEKVAQETVIPEVKTKTASNSAS